MRALCFLFLVLLMTSGCVQDSQPRVDGEDLTDENLSENITGTPSVSVRVWANDGGDKLTRDELRASKDPASTLNSVWNGTDISLFGGRNEVVSFNLVIEAPRSDAKDIRVSLSGLSAPGGSTISSRNASGDELFDFRERDIELFFVRYLEIKGLSTDLFYDHYDERHTPSRCRLPYDDDYQGQGAWSDRPCANKLYPEIAVPLELHTPFDIPVNSSQSIWGDIYIPKDTPTGIYNGTIIISMGGLPAEHIPIHLHVRDFTLPDVPFAKTMLVFSHENINYRYLGDAYPEDEDIWLSDDIVEEHFQLAHRHKISLIGNPDGYTPVEGMGRWEPALDGSLFTEAEGYRCHRGIGCMALAVWHAARDVVQL
jgi:hypothetical protein